MTDSSLNSKPGTLTVTDLPSSSSQAGRHTPNWAVVSMALRPLKGQSQVRGMGVRGVKGVVQDSGIYGLIACGQGFGVQGVWVYRGLGFGVYIDQGFSRRAASHGSAFVSPYALRISSAWARGLLLWTAWT